MRLFFTLFPLLLVGCQTTDQRVKDLNPSFSEKYRCLGNPRAKNHAVYLHGFTDENMGGQERMNYKNLSKLASSLDLMIAIPSSTKSCLHDGKRQRCWGTGMTQSEAENALRITRKAANKCFPRNRPYGLIGFSNGGYMATKVFSYCLAPKQAPLLRWIVTVGAAKLWGSGHSNRNLRSCRPITLLAGKRDTYNYERRQKKFRDLRRKGADISILLFDGGHELPYGPMVTAVRKYMR